MHGVRGPAGVTVTRMGSPSAPVTDPGVVHPFGLDEFRARVLSRWGAILGVRSFPVIFGFIHAVIDATTVSVLFTTRGIHGLALRDGIHLVLFYNLLAFAGQTPLGWLIDRFRFWRETTLGGIALAALSLTMIRVNPYAAVLLAGLGNAAFHVGAGALSLHAQPGRSAAVGIFVAPGALGLAVGTMIGKGGGMVVWPYALILAASLFIAWLAECPRVETDRPAGAPEIPMGAAIVGLLLFSIVVRSFVGKAGTYEVPREAVILFSVAAAAFAGKAMGGVLSDRLGWIAVSVGALLLSAPLLAFGGSNHLSIATGMFLFQMTMPVTLAATAQVMPGRPGLAFGLNCLAYAAGTMVHTFRFFRPLYDVAFFLVVIFASTVSLYAALRALRGRVRMKFPA